jgi:hypothetical protein
MRIILTILISLVFMGASCKPEKDRTKWDPTPIISNTNIYDTQYDPKNRIDYTSNNEKWVVLYIYGKDFSDEFGSVENSGQKECVHKISKVKIGCLIELNSYDSIRFYISGWEQAGGIGTYQIRVKREYSDWSNIVEVEVY